MLHQIKKTLRNIPGLQALHRAYHKTLYGISWVLFTNHRPLLSNIEYWLYHQYCKVVGSKRRSAMDNSDHHAKELSEKGFTIIPPTPETAALARDISQYIDSKFDGTTFSGSNITSDESFIQIDNCVQAVPTLERFITTVVERTIAQHYASPFRFYRVRMYRTLPKDVSYEELKNAWRWHTDDYPNPVRKIMVYLTDTDSTNGAFRAHPYQRSRELYKKGFFDRYAVDNLMDDLEDAESYEWIEGKAGSIAIFDNNLVHRATPPNQSKHRDVLVFELIPSHEHWKDHYDRVGDDLSSERRDHIKYPVHPFSNQY